MNPATFSQATNIGRTITFAWRDIIVGMKILWVVLILFGLYFLASAATEAGLLPSGHGTGRVSEVILGVALVGYGVFRLLRRRGVDDGTATS